MIYLVDQSKPSAQIYLPKNCMLQKMASCINLQLPIVILKKSILLDMHHHKTYMYINFQQNLTCISIFSKLWLVDQSKPCTLIYWQNIARCINLQLPIVILKKSILLDMHHHEMYMYINFQENRVNRLVIIVHTNIFAKKSQVA